MRSLPLFADYSSLDCTKIEITNIRSIDICLHKLTRAAVMLVSLLSSMPGALLLVPASLMGYVPEFMNVTVPLSYYPLVAKLVSVYLLVVIVFIVSCLTLYLVNEDTIRRERFCRYIDLPEVEYPEDFDEEKERLLAEQGFTYKYLANPSHHTMRVILVPVIALSLSGTTVRALCGLFFGW